jgi:hypothetical protein
VLLSISNKIITIRRHLLKAAMDGNYVATSGSICLIYLLLAEFDTPGIDW